MSDIHIHASGKWVEGARPEDPISLVARKALEGRFARVTDLLPQAADRGADEKSPDEIEAVHQLRVGSRRAVAAVDTFAALCPDHRRRKVIKRLKQVRRAAGEARDLDVLGGRLRVALAAEPADLVERLLGRVSGNRQLAQKPLAKTAKRLANRDFRGELEEFCARVHFRPESAGESEPDYQAAGRAQLEPLMGRLESKRPAADAPLDEWHAYRIVAKQLRYTLELFASAFGPALRDELYPVVEELQERLGKLQDHVVASERLATWRDASGGKKFRRWLGALLEREHEETEEERHSLLGWWTSDLLAGCGEIWQRLAAGPGDKEPARGKHVADKQPS